MIKATDLTGERFGRLVVLEKAAPNKRYHGSMWVCKCDCGKTTIANAQNLKSGNTTSCGCFGRIRKREQNIKHGMSNTRLHRIWKAMHTRCYNSNFFAFKYYGGRGIKVCDEWLHNFQAFHDWSMANGYQDNLTIDRIDANGNYEPSNCRWLTMAEQNQNKRAKNGYKIKE